MEFSEAFRTEDISKTDFFDFVVTPEDMGNDIVLHNNFPWSRKSIGLFANNNNNNNNSVGDMHVNGPCNNVGDPSKEANNNILPSFGDETFWGSAATTKAAFVAAAASVNVKMESPTLEDINDICWSSNGCIGTPDSDDQSRNNQRLPEKDDTTDGSIYTLTVINGHEAPNPEPPPTWYRPPDLSSILREGDEQLRQAMSAMDSNGQYQTSLDIDSIISILPSLPDSLHDQGSIDHGLFNAEPGGDLLVSGKLSQHSADSGFADSKEDSQLKQAATPSQSQGVSQGLEARGSPADREDGHYSENNNDWAFSNNEGGHSAESLLRSALQGGKSFLSQYNAPHQDTKTLTELQSGLTQPDHSSLGLFMGGDGMLPMDNGSVLLFDDSGGGMYSNGPASSASQCMDDILLSPLEDYEKLKMIEDEVAESAKRYGSLHGGGGGGGPANGMGHGHPPFGGLPVAPAPHSSTPSKPKKKSSKKSGDRQTLSNSAKLKSAVSSGGGAAGLASSSVSSTGPRRERSLHHCTICSKAFKDKYSVNVHIRTHTGEKPFACSVCGKSFRQKAHLAKHYHTHIVQKSEQVGQSKPLPAKAR